MQTLQIRISNTDLKRYNLGTGEIKFTDLVDLISKNMPEKHFWNAMKLQNKKEFQK
jgi:hypothetical protein